MSIYDNTVKTSAEERQYADTLKRRAKTGTIDVDYLSRIAGQRAMQVGDIQKSQFEGMMMSQGLGNSIVAQELARKTDRETLTNLADESRRIAMLNEQSKVDAQNALGQYGMQRSARMQSIASAGNQMQQNRWSQLADQSHDRTMNPYSWMNARQKADYMNIGSKGRI